MKIESISKVYIELYGEDDIKIMREITRLAYERINTSEPVQLRGVPLTRQAGLVGPDLFHAKEFIEKIGRACGISLPYEPYEPEIAKCTSLVTTKPESGDA